MPLGRCEGGDAALDVDHHEGGRAAVAGPAPLLHAEHLQEAAAVGETGHLVDYGHQFVVRPLRIVHALIVRDVAPGHKGPASDLPA